MLTASARLRAEARRKSCAHQYSAGLAIKRNQDIVASVNTLQQNMIGNVIKASVSGGFDRSTAQFQSQPLWNTSVEQDADHALGRSLGGSERSERPIGHLDNSNCVLAGDAGIVFQECFHRLASLEIIKESFDRNPTPSEARFTAEPLR